MILDICKESDLASKKVSEKEVVEHKNLHLPSKKAIERERR